jgi:hypothetical protein
MSGKDCEPACVLAHDLIDKLSVIVGYCEMMKEEDRNGSKSNERLDRMHTMDLDMVEKLRNRQCKLAEAIENGTGRGKDQVA